MSNDSTAPTLPAGPPGRPPPVGAWVQGHRMLLHDPCHDRYISPALLATGVFEPFETELVLDELRPGDTALDVGANVGYYTLLFARRVGPRGRVFAFEPDPANFALLRQNVEFNGYHNVVLSRFAVSDQCGPARLFLSGSNTGDHRVYDPADGRATVGIEAVSLDHFFADYTGPVHLVKMDIQGAECAALAGMRGLLGRQARLKVVAEFWPQGLRDAGASAARYLGLLLELGFRTFEINERHRALVRVEPPRLLEAFPADKEAFTNLWCVKNGTAEGPHVCWPDADVQAQWARAGDLRASERRVHSQAGEDGILEEIFRRIGTANRYCVGFGAADGDTNNSAFLTQDGGWGGFLVEADMQRCARLRARYRERGDIRVARERVTAANAEGLLEGNAVTTEFDLLSLNLDGNDYWVWAALRRWRPRVVVIGYNGSHPPPRQWVMKEVTDRTRDVTEHSGASLASLAALGREKGYALVGTDSTGVNAFFVRDDLAVGRFLDAGLHYHYSPPRYGSRNGSQQTGAAESGES